MAMEVQTSNFECTSSGEFKQNHKDSHDILCIPMISQLIALWMEEILHQLVDGADPIMIIMFTLFTVGNYW